VIPLFLGLTAFNLLCLITTTLMGHHLADGGHASGTHLLLGVLTTMATIAVHCIVFTYFIATAKWVQHAVTVKQLDPTLATPTRSFRRQAFPAALLAMITVFATAITGAISDNYGVWPGWHFGMAVGSVLINALVAWREYVAIRNNGRLIDRILAIVNSPSAVK
jgi:hypothetical protein